MMNVSRVAKIAVLGLLVVAVAPALASEEHGAAEVTLKGEVLDMACYIGHEARGEAHAECAKRCVKAGQPMGLLAEDGTVYLLYASHDDAAAFEQAKDLAGQNVELKGAPATRAGITGLEVHAVKAL